MTITKLRRSGETEFFEKDPARASSLLMYENSVACRRLSQTAFNLEFCHEQDQNAPASRTGVGGLGAPFSNAILEG